MIGMPEGRALIGKSASMAATTLGAIGTILNEGTGIVHPAPAPTMSQ
jgi:hypothetical protein